MALGEEDRHRSRDRHRGQRHARRTGPGGGGAARAAYGGGQPGRGLDGSRSSARSASRRSRSAAGTGVSGGLAKEISLITFRRRAAKMAALTSTRLT
ncbi:hypothetical protein [Microtetraspora sp. NBRC 13810]|uniref:hypothetical protein n=1 Tax=Microtetraspora sp. NBRC 13810 TaxID=3030990 RepID=UPI0025573815|nr:hypothetical protein [Microtetraspora sp. NBRC 13810]